MIEYQWLNGVVRRVQVIPSGEVMAPPVPPSMPTATKRPSSGDQVIASQPATVLLVSRTVVQLFVADIALF